ncbi:unnamed protein product, partial [Rotaria magnacalcarata]
MRIGTSTHKSIDRFYSNTILTSLTCENHDFTPSKVAQSYYHGKINANRIFDLTSLTSENHDFTPSKVAQSYYHGKINANRIFDLKHRVNGQEKFSWIYMNITRINIYNTNKNPKTLYELENAVDEVLNGLSLSVIQACIKKTQ